MTSQTLSVSLGRQQLFQVLPGGMVLLPTKKSERADCIHALRSALAILELSGGDTGTLPRDAVDADIAHEIDQITPSIKPMSNGTHQNRRTPEPLAPVRHGVITLEAVINGVVFNHDDAKRHSLLTDASELNGTHT